MRTRGRISEGAHNSAVLQYPQDRPEPPPELNEEQANEWRAIVNRLPAGWFLRETHALLGDLCRLTVRQRYLSAQGNKLEAAGRTGNKEYTQAVKLELEIAKTIMNLMTRMRLTQQSTYSKVKKKVVPQQFDQSGDEANQRRLKRIEREERLNGGQEELDQG